MNLKKQYKNLKLGAKRLFVGLLILSLFCTATGIGSIFAYAGEDSVQLEGQATNGDSIFENVNESAEQKKAEEEQKAADELVDEMIKNVGADGDGEDGGEKKSGVEQGDGDKEQVEGEEVKKAGEETVNPVDGKNQKADNESEETDNEEKPGDSDKGSNNDASGDAKDSQKGDGQDGDGESTDGTDPANNTDTKNAKSEGTSGVEGTEGGSTEKNASAEGSATEETNGTSLEKKESVEGAATDDANGTATKSALASNSSALAATQSVCDHVLEEAVYNDDGTHTGICTLCKESVTEKCNTDGENGECTKCNYKVTTRLRALTAGNDPENYFTDFNSTQFPTWVEKNVVIKLWENFSYNNQDQKASIIQSVAVPNLECYIGDDHIKYLGGAPGSDFFSVVNLKKNGLTYLAFKEAGRYTFQIQLNLVFRSDTDEKHVNVILPTVYTATMTQLTEADLPQWVEDNLITNVEEKEQEYDLRIGHDFTQMVGLSGVTTLTHYDSVEGIYENDSYNYYFPYPNVTINTMYDVGKDTLFNFDEISLDENYFQVGVTVNWTKTPREGGNSESGYTNVRLPGVYCVKILPLDIDHPNSATQNSVAFVFDGLRIQERHIVVPFDKFKTSSIVLSVLHSSLGAQEKLLKKDVDYTFTLAGPSGDVPVIDSDDNILTFYGHGLYTGTREYTFTLESPSDLTILYNGRTRNAYENNGKVTINDQVKFSTFGNKYQVSLDGEHFFDEVPYNKVITDGSIDLYFREAQGKPEFMTTVSGITIKKSLDAATAEIKYTDNVPYTLTYQIEGQDPITLVEGTDKDYTAQLLDATDNFLLADNTTKYRMQFTGTGTTYTGTKTQEFTVAELPLKFDGSTEKKAFYLNTVKIQAPAGMYISLSNGDFTSDTLNYGITQDTGQNVDVYLQNITTQKVVKQKIEDLYVVEGDISKATVVPDPIVYTADTPYTLKFTINGETRTLTEGTDYTAQLSGTASDNIPVADNITDYTYTFTGINDFKNEDKKKVSTFKVNGLDIKYNNDDTPAASYDARVKLTPPSGYQISLTSDLSSFADSATFNNPGAGQSVDVYLKKSTNNRIIKQTLTGITIVPVDISESAGKVTLTPSDYVTKAKPYELKYTTDSYTLQEGEEKDFTVELTTSDSEAVAIADGKDDTNVLTFTGVNGFTRSRTQKYKVNAQTLTFDKAALTDSKTYIASVNIEASGWKIALSADDTFSDSLKYDKEGKNQNFYVYLKKEVSDGEVLIRQKIEGLTISPPPYTFDSFFSSTGGAPTAAQNLIYNSQKQSLLVGFKSPSVPTVLEDEKLTIIYNESELTDAEKKTVVDFKPTSTESNFQESEAGDYKDVTYYVTYRYQKYKDSAKKDEIAHKIVIVSRNYGTIPIAPKNIAEVITPTSNVVMTSAGNLDYAKSNVDFEKDAFTLSFNGKALVSGTDYVRTINPALPKAGTLAKVGEHYAINFTGKGNYTGTAKYTVEVVDEEVTFNGSTKQEAKYPNKVKIGAPDGFTISFEENGSYADTVTYNEPGTKTVTVYLKNKTTGRIIAHKIPNLTITGLEVLYDGKPTQNEFYYTSCRISADGYLVSYVNSEESKDYSQYYLANKAGKYPDFPLYFMNEDTKEVTKVIIKNLWIKKDIDLPVKYNGGTYRDWFNTDVKITCDDYEISESGKNNYKDYYLVTKDGVNTYTLDFRSKKDKADVQTFDIIIRIRRSMTGEMLIRVSSQDVNVSSSSDTKAAEEAAAAKEKFQTYFDAYKNGEIQKTEDEELNILLDAYKEGSITIDDVVDYYQQKDKNSNSSESTTSIVSDDYTSDEWKGDDSVGLITREPRKISFEYNALTTDIDYILYTISEKFYSSVGDMEAEISEKSSIWRTYDDDARPTLPKDKKSYVYAKFYDKAGNYTTLSTGALIYDTVVPKMSTLSITSKQGTEGTIVAVAAKDTLSGVNKFKFKYEEKTKDKNPETPKKADLEKDGTLIEVSSESEGFSGGTYIVKDLDPDKTYVFFAIAIDRAGNISEVYRQEGQGVGGKKKEEEKKADSSLTPAPNGAAGGGEKQAGGSGSGSGAGSGAGAGGPKQDAASSESALGRNDRDITRDPFIEDATGNVRIGKNETSGWSKITGEINSADKGATVYVQMSGTANVPKDMFDSIGKRDVVVQFMVNDGVRWTVKSSDLANAQARDVNMAVKMGSKGIPAQALSDLVGTNQHIEFGVQNPEDFGFNARITVPVGTSNKGMKATLYYYDPISKELKAKEESTVDENGNASFDLNTASECTIVLTPAGMLAAGTGSQAATELLQYYPDENQELMDRAAIRLPDLFSLNGNVRIWLFVIAFTSAALCIAILFMPSMQDGDDRRNSY